MNDNRVSGQRLTHTIEGVVNELRFDWLATHLARKRSNDNFDIWRKVSQIGGHSTVTLFARFRG